MFYVLATKNLQIILLISAQETLLNRHQCVTRRIFKGKAQLFSGKTSTMLYFICSTVYLKVQSVCHGINSNISYTSTVNCVPLYSDNIAKIFLCILNSLLCSMKTSIFLHCLENINKMFCYISSIFSSMQTTLVSSQLSAFSDGAAGL